MERRNATMAVLVVGAFCLVSAFGIVAAQIGRPRRLDEPMPPPVDPYNLYPNAPQRPQHAQPPGPQARPRGRVDPNEGRMIVTDPNEIRLKLRSFPGLEQRLLLATNLARDEQRLWLPRGNVSRLTLMRAVRLQLRAELLVLRQLAQEEKAEKTVAALDGLLLSRQERFVRIGTELEQEELRMQLQTQQQGPGWQNQPMPRGRRGLRTPTQPNAGTAPGQGQGYTQPRSGGRRRRR